MDFAFDTGIGVPPRYSLTTQILGCIYLGIVITGSILFAARISLDFLLD